MIGIGKAFRILKQIKNGTFRAREFAGKEAGDTAGSVLGLPIFIFEAITLFLLVVGFTPFWFGPVPILGIIGIIFLIPLFTLIKIKKKITHAIEEHIGE